MREIFVTKPSLPPVELYGEKIRGIWERGILTNNGPLNRELEEKLSQRADNIPVRLFNNGHTALETALRSLETKGEVITTAFTFVSTVNAIENTGNIPVFCDVRHSDLTMDPDKIEALITDRTVCILPVHVYGNICDEKIREIALKHNLTLIYDGAHVFGEKLKGRPAETLGDITMVSFHATKVFNTGEGGGLYFNGRDRDGDCAECEKLRNFGLSDGEAIYSGGNGKMSEFSAALGLCSLDCFPEWTLKRKNIFRIYKKRLEGVSGLSFAVKEKKGFERNYAYAPLIFKDEETLLKVQKGLEGKNVHTRRYFYPCICDMPYYRLKYGAFLDKNELSVSESYAKRVLCLPMSTDITPEEAEEICETILSLV